MYLCHALRIFDSKKVYTLGFEVNGVFFTDTPVSILNQIPFEKYIQVSV